MKIFLNQSYKQVGDKFVEFRYDPQNWMNSPKL